MAVDAMDERAFLLTVDGEISFFRALMRARPVGIHRFFHILTMQNTILKDTGHLIHVERLWEKLREFYDLDALEAIDIEAENYIPGTSSTSSPISIRSPSPSENLAGHPYFRQEYTLPMDDTLDALIAQRRMGSTASSPAASISPLPTASTSARVSTTRKGRGGRRRGGKTKAERIDLAGLVGGDSDSSALTQESGDEKGVAMSASAGGGETPRESATATDAGTEYADDEDTEVKDRELSPAPSAPSATSPEPGPRTRGRPKSAKRGGRGGTRGATTAGSTRGVKKRKRG